eukprot:COSAG04_NODE_386_length_15303_cov_3.425151_7_plen_1858_part_00
MLHSFKANIRVFTFYCVLFHAIVVIAHDVPFNQDVLPLCPPQLDRSSGKTSKEILDDMDPTSGVTCDLTSANCYYTNKYNTPVSYNCLEQLGSTTQERRGAQEKYMALESVWDWVWDVIPLYSGPIDNSTGLPEARAQQLRTFDTMWRGDGLPVLEGDDGGEFCDASNFFFNWHGTCYKFPDCDPEQNPEGCFPTGWNRDENRCNPPDDPAVEHCELSTGNYEPKLAYLKTYGGGLFTCGFNNSEPEKRSNNTVCCQVKLSPGSDAENTTVWSETAGRRGCNWSAMDMLNPFADLYDEYDAVRMGLCTCVITLYAFRLLAQLLELWAQRGILSSQDMMAGLVVRISYYGFVFVALVGILLVCEVTGQCGSVNRWVGGVNILDELPDGASTLGSMFDLFAMVAMIPEVFSTLLQTVPYIRDSNFFYRPSYLKTMSGKFATDSSTFWKYTILWIVLIFAKLYFSYFYEIRSQVRNSATTWKAMATPFASAELLKEHGSVWDNILFNSVRSDSGNVLVAWGALVITWVPTLLVFLMDTQIAFSVAQMLVGIGVGLYLRVGQINSWDDFKFRYAKMVSKFEKHLNASERDDDGNAVGPLANAYRSRSGPGTDDETHMEQRRSAYFVGGRGAMPTGRAMLARSFSGAGNITNQAAMRHTQTSSDGSLNHSLMGGSHGGSARGVSDGMSILQTPSFRVNFVETWNRFMDKLRYDDLLSDYENSLFRCLKLSGFDEGEHEPFLPPLLTLEGVELMLDELDELDKEFSKYVFLSFNDAEKIETERAQQSAWERDESRRWQQQEANVKRQAQKWSKMAIAKCKEIRDRKSFSGPRAAIRQVQQLSFYLVNKILGSHADSPHRDAIEEASVYLDSIGSMELDDNSQTFGSAVEPFIYNLMRQGKGGPKGPRRALKAALTALARWVADEFCYPAAGLSKQRQETFDRKHVRGGFKGKSSIDKARALLKALLRQVAQLCEDPDEERGRGAQIIRYIEETLNDERGFFKDNEYAEAQLRELAKSDPSTNAVDAATYLKHILQTMQYQAAPVSNEARRRILTFASSLHMSMPGPPLVKHMRSLTTLTPFYDEDVLYDQKQITDGTPSWCFYLKAMHPHEWSNLFERLGLSGADKDPAEIPEHVWQDERMTMEVRLWASLRGQTLARVIHGVMQYDEALQTFAQHEHENEAIPQPGSPQRRAAGGGDGAVWLSETLPQRHAHQKYGYVISCQIYGNYTREKPGTARHAKVKQIADLLRLFPHLRIAYTDEGAGKHYSCLMRWDEPTGAVKEIYRVELPGHMLVGEGKPENQNHAIIFTRGECIQTLDMNQDGYYEEALKMRNLLEEFNQDRVAIIGFPEHQFTEALSATAEFAALTEFTFATLIQRTLGTPFDVRMHYGHPDVFDRLFHVTRGGISKANKVLCISEDIFGAFNSVLKGGRGIHREYIKAGKGKDLGFEQVYIFEGKISSGNGEQSLSRDFGRLCEQFDLPRLLSFFHSSNGFYWFNMLVIWATSWFIYTQILLSVIIPDDESKLLLDVTVAVTFTVQLGLVLTIPLVAELILEKGVMTTVYQLFRVFFTGGPFFFMFHIRTKAYFYDITVTMGGAKYQPTGRGFVLGHTNFVKLFRMFCNSHFNYGWCLTLNLLVYRVFIVDPNQYFAVTWATWLFALVVLYAPFLFNCLAFDRSEVEKDLESWSKFIRRNDMVDPNASWRAHWEDNNSIYSNLGTWQKANLIARNLVWLLLALAIILENLGSKVESMLVVPCILLAGITIMLLVTRNSVSCLGLGCFRQGLKSRRLRRILVLVSCIVMGVAVYVLFQKYSDPIMLLDEYAAAAGYIGAFTVNTMFYLGFRNEFIYTSAANQPPSHPPRSLI